jgi:DNA invertase Pin-like site-specific DNA recombinase
VVFCTTKVISISNVLIIGVNVLENNNLSNLKAIGYVRVSTTAQDEQNQKKAIETFCRDNNINLLKVFVDKGVSGLKRFSERSGGKSLLEFLKSNDVDAVIVVSIDRIARDSLDLKNTIEFFKSNGIRLISLSDKEQWINYLFDEEADDVYKLVANILLETLSFFANFELQKRKERQELAWSSGKQKGRPRKVSDSEIIKYLKTYRPQGLSLKSIWSIMKVKYEEEGKDFISYDRFRKRVASLRKAGKIREVYE